MNAAVCDEVSCKSAVGLCQVLDGVKLMGAITIIFLVFKFVLLLCRYHGWKTNLQRLGQKESKSCLCRLPLGAD